MRPSLVVRSLMILVGSAAGVFAFLVVTTIWVGHPIEDSLLSAHGVLVDSSATQGLSASERETIRQLTSDGRLISADNLLTEMARYYGGAIQSLLVAFSVLGIIAFMYVKAVSAEQAESAVEKSVSQYFRTQDFVDSISEKITNAARAVAQNEKDLVRTYIEDLDSRLKNWEGWGPDQLQSMLDRIELIETRLGKLDTEDEQGEERELDDDVED